MHTRAQFLAWASHSLQSTNINTDSIHTYPAQEILGFPQLSQTTAWSLDVTVFIEAAFCFVSLYPCFIPQLITKAVSFIEQLLPWDTQILKSKSEGLFPPATQFSGSGSHPCLPWLQLTLQNSAKEGHSQDLSPQYFPAIRPGLEYFNGSRVQNGQGWVEWRGGLGLAASQDPWVMISSS